MHGQRLGALELVGSHGRCCSMALESMANRACNPLSFSGAKLNFSVQENAKLIVREKIDKKVFTFSGPALGVFLP